jgi:hypothetical protein
VTTPFYPEASTDPLLLLLLQGMYTHPKGFSYSNSVLPVFFFFWLTFLFFSLPRITFLRNVGEISE